MNQCAEYIEQIYKNPKVITLVRSIKPVELQDDLLQELAIVLLEYDCDKLIQINKDGKLINFAMSIVWKMGTLQNGYFYKTYKKSHIKQAVEYFESQQGEEIPTDYIEQANNILNNKLATNPNEAHESILFTKYVELQSCQKVADYFGIPRLHVFQVVNNVKKELKKKIRI
jgi:hypothetical protein